MRPVMLAVDDSPTVLAFVSEVLSTLTTDPEIVTATNEASSRTTEIPIVLLTAVTGDTDKVRLALETGAMDFMAKPVDPHALQGVDPQKAGFIGSAPTVASTENAVA